MGPSQNHLIIGLLIVVSGQFMRIDWLALQDLIHIAKTIDWFFLIGLIVVFRLFWHVEKLVRHVFDDCGRAELSPWVRQLIYSIVSILVIASALTLLHKVEHRFTRPIDVAVGQENANVGDYPRHAERSFYTAD